MEWKDSIAVLPFEDGSKSKDQGPLCEQMTIDIIGKLSQIEGLSVKPYKTVESDKDRDISNKEIGKELGVTRILESYLKMEDNRIKVYSHIIDAKKDSIIKSFEYDEDFDDIFEVQDNLTREIAKTLGFSIVGEIFKEYKKIEPKDTEAYSYYVSGRNFEKKYTISKEENDFASARRMYEEALNVDPNYAKAYWGLGKIYEIKYNINPEDQDMEDLQSAIDNFWKSYQINPNLAESHLGLGWAFFYKADNDNAFDFFKSALKIEPNNSEINHHAGAFFVSIGLYPQAIKFCSKAVELDPLNYWAHHIRAYCSMYVGDYDKAAGYFQSALNIDPNNLELLSLYTFFFIFTKNIEEAEKVFEKAEKIDEQDNWRIRQARGLLLAIKGEKEEALLLIQDRPFSYFATSIYSLLGMKDEVVKNIQVGIEEGFKYRKIYLYPYPFLENNPCYDSLRDDSRFQDIIKEEKMKYQEKRFKYGKL
jgi:TolB-like protein/Tfp pilus assembly protein PilF